MKNNGRTLATVIIMLTFVLSLISLVQQISNPTLVAKADTECLGIYEECKGEICEDWYGTCLLEHDETYCSSEYAVCLTNPDAYGWNCCGQYFWCCYYDDGSTCPQPWSCSD